MSVWVGEWEIECVDGYVRELVCGQMSVRMSVWMDE